MLKLLIPLSILLLLPSNKKWHFTPPALLTLSFTSSNLLNPTHHFSPHPLLSIDHLSSPLILLTIWISALMISANIYAIQKPMHPSITTLTLTLSMILSLAFSVNNLLTFYIFFEASLIPTLLLILLWGYNPDRLRASTYMMMYTISASLPLMMMLLLLKFNNTHLNMIFMNWQLPPLISPQTWWSIASLAFLVKIPLFSLHLWLPKAHVEAPISGSIILASILLKLGLYGIIRITTPSLHPHPLLTMLLMSLSLWGALTTSIMCIRQTDLKALIAYSSVSHMALATAGALSMSTWGWNGALAMMITHGLCSPALFTLASTTFEMTNSRSLFLTKGMMSLSPSLTLWWFLFSASNMSIPPSPNLVAEITLITAILSKSTLFIPLITFLIFFTATYNIHLYVMTQHGPPPHFMNPLTQAHQSHHTTMFLIMTPLSLLILKPNLFTTWT